MNFKHGVMVLCVLLFLTALWWKSIDAADGLIEAKIPLSQIRPCCACGTAKYQLTFKGLWSKETHPKDFPSGIHAATVHWSDIVGASHSPAYQLYSYGDMASLGVQRLCEWGDASKIESEIKNHSTFVRTVIRMRGIYIQLRQSRWARFSVNNTHHLLSILSMIGPSPDWCSGVSAINLCKTDCTWEAERTYSLYPWDAGTDGGITYNSNDKPLLTHVPIFRINETLPNNPDAPFFNPGIPIAPVAQLILKKIYSSGSVCNPQPDNLPKIEIRPDLLQTNRTLPTRRPFSTTTRFSSKRAQLEQMCRVTEWDLWTPCSVSCGFGFRMRSRQLLKASNADVCSTSLREKQSCMNKQCDAKVEDFDPTLCSVTLWSTFSRCSVTCSTGFMLRTRSYIHPMGASKCSLETMQKKLCSSRECKLTYKSMCTLSADRGLCRATFMRWFYDQSERKCRRFVYGGCLGNDNNFESKDKCEKMCSADNIKDSTEPPPRRDILDCKVTVWSTWGRCSSTCGRGYTTRYRIIKQKPKPGGRQCPKKLVERKKCRHARCPKEPVNCLLSEWTQWYPCDKTCGVATSMRTRQILKRGKYGGTPCSEKVERKFCMLPVCPDKSVASGASSGNSTDAATTTSPYPLWTLAGFYMFL